MKNENPRSIQNSAELKDEIRQSFEDYEEALSQDIAEDVFDDLEIQIVNRGLLAISMKYELEGVIPFSKAFDDLLPYMSAESINHPDDKKDFIDDWQLIIDGLKTMIAAAEKEVEKLSQC